MYVRDPHSFSDTRQGRITHIEFDLQVDFDARVVRGSADYRLENPVAGPLYLDVRDLVVDRVSGGGVDLPWSVDQMDPVRGGRLHVTNAKGLDRIRIEFATAPAATALGWLEPSQTAGGRHPFLLTQCQAIHARSVFPCQDSPSVRFTYDAVVRAPAPLAAAMSADRVSMTETDGRTVAKFRMPQAIPSYLFALAVGDFGFKPLGPRSGVFAEPELLEAAAWEFADTERMIALGEQLFGPYQWDTYNMLILPPAFPYGGMENPRLTFLTPTLVVGDRSLVAVVAHELAHSWTGNLVTNATWEDFWLNEGWTVYAERRILAALEGEDFVQLQAALRRESMLNDMRIFGMDSKPTCLNYSQEGIDPDDVFSLVPYEKGCAFLLRCEQVVGRERFDALIRSYIAAFRFRSLTTRDFLEFLGRELPGIEKQVDIQRWVFQPGMPDDATAPASPLLDAARTVRAAFLEGRLPEASDVRSWRPQQIEVFLQELPRPLGLEQCRALEALFGIGSTRNRNLQTEFYALALRSGYREVLPAVERLLGSVGRMLYLKPLYRALAETDWCRAQARPLFERCRRGYHPIAVRAVERILDAAGA